MIKRILIMAAALILIYAAAGKETYGYLHNEPDNGLRTEQRGDLAEHRGSVETAGEGDRLPDQVQSDRVGQSDHAQPITTVLRRLNPIRPIPITEEDENNDGERERELQSDSEPAGPGASGDAEADPAGAGIMPAG